MDLVIKNNLSINLVTEINNGDSSVIFHILYNNQDIFITAGMRIEDYFYSQLYWSCRYLYEVTARGDVAPDFEASIIDILNYFVIVLEERYGEDIDSKQIQDIDRILEKEFNIRRPGSFIY